MFSTRRFATSTTRSIRTPRGQAALGDGDDHGHQPADERPDVRDVAADERDRGDRRNHRQAHQQCGKPDHRGDDPGHDRAPQPVAAHDGRCVGGEEAELGGSPREHPPLDRAQEGPSLLQHVVQDQGAEHDAGHQPAQCVDAGDHHGHESEGHERPEARHRVGDALGGRRIELQLGERRLQLGQQLVHLAHDADDDHPDERHRRDHERDHHGTCRERLRDVVAPEPSHDRPEEDGQDHGEEERQHHRAGDGKRSEDDGGCEAQPHERPRESTAAHEDAGGRLCGIARHGLLGADSPRARRPVHDLLLREVGDRRMGSLHRRPPCVR
jgi:hypothetical protein